MSSDIFSVRYKEYAEKVNRNIDLMSIEELKELLKEGEEVMQQYRNLELVVKKDANSLYGTSASIYFSLCDFDVAEDITGTGRHYGIIVDRAINNFYVNWGEKELEIINQFYPNVTELRKFKEYKPDTVNDVCVYGDTDSRYIDLGMIYKLMLVDGVPMTLPPANEEGDKELSDFSVFLMDNFINELIRTTILDDVNYRNAYDGYLKMAHEVTTRKGVFQAKKKYVLVKVWEDGKVLDKPKLKTVGVELKQGGLNPRIKKIISELVNKFLLEGYTSDQLRVECLGLMKYIKRRNEKSFIYKISSVSGLNEIVKNEEGIYINSADKSHINMKMALFWYNFIDKNQIARDLYKQPFEGQKMNFYYDMEGKVVAVPDDIDINTVSGLPAPDYNKMLEQILIKPLLRYINSEKVIKQLDIDSFLLGVIKINI